MLEDVKSATAKVKVEKTDGTAEIMVFDEFVVLGFGEDGITFTGCLSEEGKLMLATMLSRWQEYKTNKKD